MVDAAISGNPDLPQMMKTIIPMSRIAKAEEIADVVLFMTSPRSSYVTGTSIIWTISLLQWMQWAFDWTFEDFISILT